MRKKCGKDWGEGEWRGKRRSDGDLRRKGREWGEGKE